MKRIVLALLALLALSLPANAQCNGVFAAGYACGNATSASAPPKPVDAALLTAVPGGYAPVSGSCASGAAAAVDSTATLTTYGNRSKPALLAPNKCYKITSSVVLTTSGGGFVSDGTATIYMPAASFNSTTLCSRSNCTTSNAIGIYAHGELSGAFTPISHITFSKFAIQSEVSDGRAVGAINASNINGLTITGLEIYGFPVGFGITANSIIGDGYISENYIHDFTTNAVWATEPQITGIDIDAGRVNSVNSIGLHIQNNTISDMTFGAVPLGSYGYQTDGMTIESFTGRHYHVITGNRINNVGEAIDNFSSYSVIANNTITNAHSAATKLGTSSSYTLLDSNTIYQCGLACVLVYGYTAGGSDSVGNFITNNAFNTLDQDGLWAAFNTACIRIGSSGLPSIPMNTNIVNNTCNATGGKYGIFASAGDGTGTTVLANQISNASVASVSVDSSTGGYSDLTTGTLTTPISVTDTTRSIVTLTSSGNSTSPMALVNAGTANQTKACLELNASNTTVDPANAGNRSTLLCSRNDGTNSQDFQIYTSNGTQPAISWRVQKNGQMDALNVIASTSNTTGSITSAGGIGAAGMINANQFGLNGNISAPAWTTSGVRYKNAAVTLTDTTSSGVVATAYSSTFGGSTIAASNPTTFTNYFGSFFTDPSTGTNVTFTNKYAIGADSAKFTTATIGTATIGAGSAILTSVTIGAGSAITSSGAGGALGTAAFQNTGTSGANLPFLNGTNTWSALNTYQITSAGAQTIPVTAQNNSGTVATEVCYEMNPTNNASNTRSSLICGKANGGAITTNFYNSNGAAPALNVRINANGQLEQTITTATSSSTAGAIINAGGYATSNATDATSTTNGGTFTSAGGGAFAKTLYANALVISTTENVGSATGLTLASGERGFAKIAASGSAPGNTGGKMALVCGTGAGTAKLIMYAGTSTTPSTIVDNIGAGVSGC